MSGGGFISPLDDAAVNLKGMRQAYRKELTEILKFGEGEDDVTKALVLDKTISGPLQLVAELSLLKKQGVAEIYLLEKELVTDCSHIIYIIRPNSDAVKSVVQHILTHKGDIETADKSYNVVFMPRVTMECEKALEDGGVKGDVIVSEFCMELIPFDEDIVSLELPDSYRECFLEGDPSSLYYVASCLMKMQALFGLIPSIKCKGDNASQVLKMMKRMKRESVSQLAFPIGVPSEIDTLILIDRKVDPVTPLVTQFTYEGLIDELLGINNSYIEVDPEIISDSKKGENKPVAPKGGPKRKLALNSNDPIFKEIRDLHFSVLGPYLNKKAQVIQDTYDKRHEALTVGEMHSFMQKFKTAHSEHSSLTTHTNVASLLHQTFVSKKFNRVIDIHTSMLNCENEREVEEFIDEIIAKMEPFEDVLRTLCLYSVTNGGIRQKKFDQIKRDILQTYGFEKMLTLDNLEELSLLTKQRGRNPWPTLRKNLKLVVDREKINMQAPHDISYVCGGYAPLSVRLVELATSPGWRKIEADVLQYLPGKYTEESQDLNNDPDREGFGGARTSVGGGKAPTPNTPTTTAEDGRKPLTMVFFIGGVTFAEISALRHLALRENHGREYLIATTKLINAKTLMKSVVEDLDNRLRPSSIGF